MRYIKNICMQFFGESQSVVQNLGNTNRHIAMDLWTNLTFMQHGWKLAQVSDQQWVMQVEFCKTSTFHFIFRII